MVEHLAISIGFSLEAWLPVRFQANGMRSTPQQDFEGPSFGELG